MLKFIIFILIVVPAMEIGLLLLSGKMIGVWQTILLMITTGIVGAWLAKKQGLKTLIKAQEQMHNGQLPGDAIIDGLCILIGGIFLLTPGFITDLFGLFLLLPLTRGVIKPLIVKILRKMISNGNFFIIR